MTKELENEPKANQKWNKLNRIEFKIANARKRIRKYTRVS